MQRVFDIASITSMAAAWGVLLARTAPGLTGPWLWWAPAVVLAGLLAADFTSGMTHFLADKFGNPKTPWLGRTFIHPFREHHVDPMEITRHDFFNLNGAPTSVVFLFALPAAIWPPPAALGLFMLVWIAGLVFTNTIHRWAHLERPPRFVRFLQRWGVFLMPEEHRRHHEAPHDRRYCITFGWLNPFLDWIGFFTRFERLLRWAFTRRTPRPAETEARVTVGDK